MYIMTLLFAIILTIGIILASLDSIFHNPNTVPMPDDMKIWLLSLIAASWLAVCIVRDLKGKT